MIIKKELRYYISPKGKAPFVTWLNKIKDFTVRSRIERRLERIELGNYGDFKAIGDGIYELRLAFGSGYRIYFAETEETIVLLLCGGDKSTQSKDIELAKYFWQEFKGRKP
jgi:putative addiction module killer protein